MLEGEVASVVRHKSRYTHRISDYLGEGRFDDFKNAGNCQAYDTDSSAEDTRPALTSEHQPFLRIRKPAYEERSGTGDGPLLP